MLAETLDGPPVLELEGLDVHYGHAHAVQGVSLTLGQGVLAVIGRNGMGKSSVCNAVAGVIAARGQVRMQGQPILGLPAHRIARMGLAYVPQGRRLWPSLSVHEHLRLAGRPGLGRPGPWSIERIYETFPRLAERRSNGGSQLSGGEQQMVAIARALLLNPTVVVMDEPTEGLAPVIVQQMCELFRRLARDERLSILLVEQNLQVAIDVADRVAVMANGRITHSLAAAELRDDRGLQRRLLGFESESVGHGAPVRPRTSLSIGETT